MTPRATYRLQFHKGFTFANAQAQAGYFAQLGISHIYASPILTARAGSQHGYDVVDHRHINPEVGGEAAFRAMAKAFAQNGLGLIVDIVPNHVAVGKADNCWWQDLLANGADSRYASTFDIDWDAPGLGGKVLAPFLGEEPREALQKGVLRLERNAGQWAFTYYDHRFPLRPQDQRLAGMPQAVEDLERLLARQNFILAHWRVADSRINWRRFFDITDLAAIRIAEEGVFEAVHSKLFELYAEGLIDGVRIDHVDGLADPRAYCRTLRARLEALRPGANIWVEKILADGESIPPDWEVNGTTGYDFLNEASALLHRENVVLERLWHERSGRDLDFEGEELLARREILRSKFSGQVASTARAFSYVIGMPVPVLEEAICALVVRLRCYRSYATGKPDTPGPGPFLVTAFEHAAVDMPQGRHLLGMMLDVFRRDDGNDLVVDAIRRFSQLSAPVAAKAVEDTAFYRYGRLLSRNDVGCNPARLAMSVPDFHARMVKRAAKCNSAMLATATHDHKRGEDARARLTALSLRPRLWEVFATGISSPSDLDSGDVYQLHQTLFGVWDEPDERFVARIEGWCTKFLREGKLRSSWTDPDKDYEKRFTTYARSLVNDLGQAPLRRDMAQLLIDLAPEIRLAMISQLVLRNTVPGVPDLYQGCEFEDLSLVDPDNRREVDFAARQEALAAGSNEKQLLLIRLLNARRQDPFLWERGDYTPLDVGDSRCLSFARRYGDATLVVYIRRDLQDFGSDLSLERDCTDLLTGHGYQRGALSRERLFLHWPAAVLYFR
jgi:(1->4)-alpha-D-glucan 1-alpha-D-glucosylmutase